MPEFLLVYDFFLIEFELMGMLAARAVIYQPQYFPRLHYFARILAADVFSIADDVQFVRKHAYRNADGTSHNGPSYQAHTPIYSRNGTLLLDYATERTSFKSIRETRLVYDARCDRYKNLRLIAQEYRKAPQYAHVFPTLERFFGREYASVADINIASIYWGLEQLFEVSEGEAATRLPHAEFRLSHIARSSHSGVALSDKAAGRDANDWLVDLCRAYGADEYYFGGTGASSYMDFTKFEKANIRLVQQEWKLKPYPQLHGDFIPNLSIIDLLMNVTPAEARERLRTMA